MWKCECERSQQDAGIAYMQCGRCGHGAHGVLSERSPPPVLPTYLEAVQLQGPEDEEHEADALKVLREGGREGGKGGGDSAQGMNASERRLNCSASLSPPTHTHTHTYLSPSLLPAGPSVPLSSPTCSNQAQSACRITAHVTAVATARAAASREDKGQGPRPQGRVTMTEKEEEEEEDPPFLGRRQHGHVAGSKSGARTEVMACTEARQKKRSCVRGGRAIRAGGQDR